MNYISVQAREALADLDDPRTPLPVRCAVVADLVTALIQFLDDTDADPDSEPNDDDEPSLGWADAEARFGRYAGDSDDQEEDSGNAPEFTNEDGGDISDEPHDEAAEGNAEHSLGWSEEIDQERRAAAADAMWSVPDGEEDSGDMPELVNENGGDVQDEPHDPDTDLEHSLGWGFGIGQGEGYMSWGNSDGDREGIGRIEGGGSGAL